MQTLIRFNGHITWEGRTNGLPEVIYAFVILDEATPEFIVQMIEQQMNWFTSRQLMFVQREQGEVIDIRTAIAQRMAVPFHTIAFIDVDVMPLTGELSNPDESGVERLSNGEEPVKQ